MPEARWIELAVALVTAVIAFVLAMSEAALAATSRARAEHLAETGVRGGERLRTMSEDPAPYLNTSLLVRTLCEVATTVLVALVVFTSVSATWERLLIAIAAMVVVRYIGWGVAPLTLGRQRAGRIAPRVAGVMSALTTVLGPIPQLMILFGNALTPGRGYTDGPFSSEAELRELVDRAEASEVIESDERRMIHSVFDLGDTLVKEVMVPRTDIVFIQQQKTLRQALSLALRSGYSRIPVIGEGLDDIVGVLYVKDVMRRVYDHPEGERSEVVADMMRPPVFTPDSKPVDELLREMQLNRNHIVLVVDEFGGTAGLATIEDILEEIVGEIVDEYDAEPTHTEEIEPGLFRISARMPVEDLGELFGLDVDDDDVETVGGLMAKQLSMVPIPGSAIDWEGIHIVAETTTGRRHQIGRCLVHLTAETDTDDPDTATKGSEHD
ncbi:MAG TPA: hemolysin family protein [Propionibacteriaceae bacterium]|nr:hemolysin family protein [Propionibacteriaceae bacterium]